MKGFAYFESVESLWREGGLSAETEGELEARFPEEWRALEDEILKPEVQQFLLNTRFLFRSHPTIVAFIETGIARNETWRTLFERFYAEEDDLQVEMYLHSVLWSCRSHDEYVRAMNERIEQANSAEAFPEVRWIHKASYALDHLPESGSKILHQLRLVLWAVRRVVSGKDTLSNIMPLFRRRHGRAAPRSRKPEQCLVDLAERVSAARQCLVTLLISGRKEAQCLQTLGEAFTKWPDAMPWTYPGKAERIALRENVKAGRYQSSPALHSYLLRLIDTWDCYNIRPS